MSVLTDSPIIILFEDRQKQSLVFQLNLSIYLDAKVTIAASLMDLEALSEPGGIHLVVTRANFKGLRVVNQIAETLEKHNAKIPVICLGDERERPGVVVVSDDSVKPMLQNAAKFLGVTAAQMVSKQRPDMYEIKADYLGLLFTAPCDVFKREASGMKKVFSLGDSVPRAEITRFIESKTVFLIESLKRLKLVNAVTEQGLRATDADAAVVSLGSAPPDTSTALKGTEKEVATRVSGITEHIDGGEALVKGAKQEALSEEIQKAKKEKKAAARAAILKANPNTSRAEVATLIQAAEAAIDAEVASLGSILPDESTSLKGAEKEVATKVSSVTEHVDEGEVPMKGAKKQTISEALKAKKEKKTAARAAILKANPKMNRAEVATLIQAAEAAIDAEVLPDSAPLGSGTVLKGDDVESEVVTKVSGVTEYFDEGEAPVKGAKKQTTSEALKAKKEKKAAARAAILKANPKMNRAEVATLIQAAEAAIEVPPNSAPVDSGTVLKEGDAEGEAVTKATGVTEHIDEGEIREKGAKKQVPSGEAHKAKKEKKAAARAAILKANPKMNRAEVAAMIQSAEAAIDAEVPPDSAPMDSGTVLKGVDAEDMVLTKVSGVTEHIDMGEALVKGTMAEAEEIQKIGKEREVAAHVAKLKANPNTSRAEVTTLIQAAETAVDSEVASLGSVLLEESTALKGADAEKKVATKISSVTEHIDMGEMLVKGAKKQVPSEEVRKAKKEKKAATRAAILKANPKMGRAEAATLIQAAEAAIDAEMVSPDSADTDTALKGAGESEVTTNVSSVTEHIDQGEVLVKGTKSEAPPEEIERVIKERKAAARATILRANPKMSRAEAAKLIQAAEAAIDAKVASLGSVLPEESPALKGADAEKKVATKVSSVTEHIDMGETPVKASKTWASSEAIQRVKAEEKATAPAAILNGSPRTNGGEVATLTQAAEAKLDAEVVLLGAVPADTGTVLKGAEKEVAARVSSVTEHIDEGELLLKATEEKSKTAKNLKSAAESRENEFVSIKGEEPKNLDRSTKTIKAEQKEERELKMKSLVGCTDLMRAAVSDALDKAAEILATDSSVEMRKRDAEGRTALHYAAIGGSVAVLKALIDKGAQINNVDSKRQSAIFLAALHKQNEAFDFLLAHGAKINQQGMDGTTIAMIGAISGNMHILKTAIEKGVRADAHDNSGRTALDFAKQAEATEAIAYLSGLAPKGIVGQR